MRVVSLLPSSTEIVCALGCRDLLVGRSHECDHPPGVEELPACTAPKFDPDGTSYQVDQRVKAILQEAASVYRVDADLLDELAPDWLVTQSQCEVCAVSLKDVEEAACRLVRSRPSILSLEPNRLEDLWDDIGRVAEALEVEDRGRSVACIEWFEPLMAAGNWIPELVEAAGGRCLFGEAGAHSPWLSWEALEEAQPEFVLLMPCGFDIPRSRRELPALTRQPAWSRLRAVREGRVCLTDGNQFFNRPGPRLVESAEIVAETLHPGEFEGAREHRGWERLEAGS